MDKKNIIILVLYLFALFFWTLPINEMPFGDVDSSAHFTSGDYMVYTDKSIYRLPYYLIESLGYGTAGYFGYPPQFNAGEAIIQILGGHRIISVYLFIAVLCSSFLLSSYLLIRKLYGFMPALLAFFLLIFSKRDILYYLWGLWPQTIAFSFVPLIIYSYYRFICLQTDRGNEDKDRKHYLKYLYLTLILVSIQYTFHPQAFLFSIAFIFIYSFVLALSKKKLPFKIKDLFTFFILLLVVIFLLAPFQFRVFLGMTGIIDIGVVGEGDYGFKPENIGSLFHWFKVDEKYFASVPPDYFSYSKMYGGYWTLPLLLLGLIFLFIRRKKQDILVISWLITLYLFLHMDIFGGTRNFRFLQLEAQLFSLIIVIGLMGGLINIISFVGMSAKNRSYIKYGLAVLFIIAGLSFNAGPVYSQLKDSYKGVTRLNEAEYNAALWMRENLPEEANIMLAGTVAYNKKKWFRGLSFRNVFYDTQIVTQQNAERANYVLVDYSDLIMLGNKEAIGQLQQWEQGFLANTTLLYNKDDIRVYSLENRQ